MSKIESETAVKYDFVPAKGLNTRDLFLAVTGTNMKKNDTLRGIASVSPEFKAMIELTRRYLREELAQKPAMSNPQMVRDYLQISLKDIEHECFYVLYLNSKHEVINEEALFRGTVDNASVPIREVVKEGLANNAAAMIVAHNHPSGNPTPSQSDKTLTENLYMALNMVGIKMLDHFVVGQSEVVSLAELGYCS